MSNKTRVTEEMVERAADAYLPLSEEEDVNLPAIRAALEAVAAGIAKAERDRVVAFLRRNTGRSPESVRDEVESVSFDWLMRLLDEVERAND